MVANPVHDREFLGIGAVDSQLRRGMLRRQRIHEFGDRLPAADHLRNNPRAGVDGVIKTKIPVTDEDMARHFAGKRRAKLLHPLFHMAVAGLPDLCRCAKGFNQAQRRLRRFDVEKNRRPGMAVSDIARQECRQQIARHLPPLGIDDADAITISVKTNPEIGFRCRHLAAQNLQRFRIDRIGMVVREGAVNVREQHLVCAIKPADERLGDRAAGAIAAIPDHRQTRRRGAVGKPVDIGWLDVVICPAAAILFGHAIAADHAKMLDVIAKKGQPAHDHLEAVMGWRVMAAGDLDGAATGKLMRGKIQHRRGTAANIKDICAAGNKSIHQRGGERRRRQPAVAPHNNIMPKSAITLDGNEGQADGIGIRRCQRFIENAADVVGPQNGRVEAVAVHPSRVPSQWRKSSAISSFCSAKATLA